MCVHCTCLTVLRQVSTRERLQHVYRAWAQAECHSSDSVCVLRGRAKAARAARQAGASAKRRKMMADLETRERVWKSERSEEEAARAKLKVGSAGLARSAFLSAAAAGSQQALPPVCANLPCPTCYRARCRRVTGPFPQSRLPVCRPILNLFEMA